MRNNLKKEQILIFLKSQDIDIQYFSSDFKVNENLKILFNSCVNKDEEYKIYFNKSINIIKYVDLTKITNKFLLDIINDGTKEKLIHGIYIELGKIQGIKKYSRKKSFGALLMFFNDDFEKIKLNKIDDFICISDILIEFNQEIFEKAILDLD